MCTVTDTLEGWRAMADSLGLPHIPGAVRTRFLDMEQHHRQHHETEESLRECIAELSKKPRT